MRTEHQTAFDLWLHDALAREAGAVEAEALPDELVRLLPKDEGGRIA